MEKQPLVCDKEVQIVLKALDMFFNFSSCRTTENTPVQLDLFTDYEAGAQKQKQENEAAAKERRLQEAALKIKKEFGKNALLRGLNYAEGATQKDRNNQIGGHKA